MTCACPSRSPVLRAAFALALVFASPPARAAEPTTDPQFVVIPPDCLPFYIGSHEPPVSRAWDSMLSLAACIQDGSVGRVERADQLVGHLEKLQAGLVYPLKLYQIALERAPAPVQLQAAYYVALGQVALITRARSSLATPELRPRLERLLEPHAKFAFLVFTTINNVSLEHPSLARDVVTRSMIRSSRELAASLRKGWSFTTDDPPLLALPR